MRGFRAIRGLARLDEAVGKGDRGGMKADMFAGLGVGTGLGRWVVGDEVREVRGCRRHEWWKKSACWERDGNGAGAHGV